MHKLIIFDIDGTLLDTREFINQSFVHVALTHAGLSYTTDTLPSFLHSGSLKQCYAQFLPHINFEVCADEHETFQKNNLHLIQKYEDLIDVLTTLKASNMYIAALTNRRRQSAHFNLKLHEIDSFFDIIVCDEDVSQTKPHPEGIYKIMNHIGVTSAQTYMIGDTETDIRAGKNAKTTTIGVTHGFSTHDKMKEVGPDHIIHSLSELVPLLLPIRT